MYAAHEELTAAWNGAATPAPRDKTAAAARLEEARAALEHRAHRDRRGAQEADGRPRPCRADEKALATLDREWDGLAAHRDYPMIGLDNNPAGRMIRGPVVTRKNAGLPQRGHRPERRRDLDKHRHRPDGPRTS